MNVLQTSPRIDKPEIGFGMNHVSKESKFYKVKWWCKPNFYHVYSFEIGWKCTCQLDQSIKDTLDARYLLRFKCLAYKETVIIILLEVKLYIQIQFTIFSWCRNMKIVTNIEGWIKWFNLEHSIVRRRSGVKWISSWSKNLYFRLKTE